MSQRSISDARENFADVLRDALDEPVEILRHGERIGVIVSPTMFDKALEALEDQADEAAFDLALDGETLPWDEVKKELGLA
jgi:prevent-host-death family protein